MSDKTHWKKAFNKDFLGAHDLDEGEELKLTIREVKVQEITDPQGAKEERNVAHFVEKVKPMILNVTACKTLKKFSKSKYIEDWTGVKIQVYATEVKAFGEITDALRIREQQPRTDKENLEPGHKKWAGAVAKYKETKKLDTIKKYYNLTKDNEKKLIDEAAASQD